MSLRSGMPGIGAPAHPAMRWASSFAYRVAAGSAVAPCAVTLSSTVMTATAPPAGAANLGPGRQIVSQDSPHGVSRIGGQAGTQDPGTTPVSSRNRGSRAGSTIHSLPAESELWVEPLKCRDRERRSLFRASSPDASSSTAADRGSRPGRASPRGGAQLRVSRARSPRHWQGLKLYPGGRPEQDGTETGTGHAPGI